MKGCELLACAGGERVKLEILFLWHLKVKNRLGMMLKIFVYIVSFVFVFASSDSGWLLAPTFGTLPPSRTNQAGAVVDDLYCVFGGRDPMPMNDLWCFSLLADTLSWIQLSAQYPPQARYGHIAVAYDKGLYVFGGTAGNGECFSSLWTFHWPNGEWIELSSGPQLVHHAAAVVGTTMFVFGGTNASSSLQNDLWMYDFCNDTWTCLPTMSEMPSPRKDASLVGDSVRRLLWMFGGRGESESNSELWIFDIATHLWVLVNQAVSSPGPRYGSMMCSDNNQLLLYGGLFDDLLCWSDTWRLNMSCTVLFHQGCWSTVSSFAAPDARAFATMDVYNESIGIMYGGYCPGTVIFSDVWLFAWNGIEAGSLLMYIVLIALLAVAGLIVLSLLAVVCCRLLFRWHYQREERRPLLTSMPISLHAPLPAAVVQQPGGATAVGYRVERNI
eukprot:TRINITY_DN6568_c0_g1_i1.p1 TRINITY_DN6568_c0_g1~~TRINITY_DN6568_c0_g1_i1.p1  ORF type:complete len:443 (+),score=34.70 TRINITY_DN6568_c0_g1_i1:23-1351(+)